MFRFVSVSSIFIKQRLPGRALPAMAEPLERLAEAGSRYSVSKFVIHRAAKGTASTSALRCGVKAVPIQILATVMCVIGTRMRRGRWTPYYNRARGFQRITCFMKRPYMMPLNSVAPQTSIP